MAALTIEIISTLDIPLTVEEIAELNRSLSNAGFNDFTGGAGDYKIIYFGESNEDAFNNWVIKLNNTLNQFFNGRPNNFSSGSHIVKAWYQAANTTKNRGRSYTNVKSNLQKRYAKGEGYGDKRASDTGDNEQQGGEQGGSNENNGQSILEENHSAETQKFFTEVQEGKHKPKNSLSFLLPLDNVLKKIHDAWIVFKGNFDDHIETNIPPFREVQLKKISDILDFLPNGGRVIDLGGSTGAFVKTITSLNPKIKSENLDPNDAMIAGHNKNPVEGSVPVKAAFLEGFDDG